MRSSLARSSGCRCLRSLIAPLCVCYLSLTQSGLGPILYRKLVALAVELFAALVSLATSAIHTLTG